MVDQRSTTKKKLFNLYHFSLQTVVERIFGVSKHQFYILKTPAEFTIDV